MKRILFICLGNICRSPVAEGVMKKLTETHPGLFHIESRGTNRWHKGEGADPRAVASAERAGVNIQSHIAKRLTLQDFEAFDLLYYMAADVFDEILELNPSRQQLAKCVNFLDAVEDRVGEDVPDPYYGGRKEFDETYGIIVEGCQAILEDALRSQTQSSIADSEST